MSDKTLYNKIRDLRPDLSSGVTPDALNKISVKPHVESFIKWFCNEITRANVLLEEEVKIKDYLHESGKWLEDDDLDNALGEATRDCPELLELVTFNDEDMDNLIAQADSLKEIYNGDQDYINTLNNTLKTYREIGHKLDDDIENEENLLEREHVEMKKTYEDCSLILEEFDESHREFSNNVEDLLRVYTDAATNKGSPLLWTQMPIERLLEQLKLQSDHLQVYIKKQFENTNTDNHGISQNSSDYETLMGDSKEKRDDTKIQELISCKLHLNTAKIDVIAAKTQEECTSAMLKYAIEIYNNGILRVPSQREIQTEILELTRKRNLLEESVALLQEQQLYITTQKFAENEMMKILKRDAQARLGRRKARLDKLKNLLCLTRENGHVHSDLLCMLMDIQYHRLRAVAEFVADAHHYLSAEYLLSSMRCNSMQIQNEEYNKILTSSKPCNSFSKLFVSMVSGDESSPEPLKSALKKYNELLIENAEKKHQLLDAHINDRLERLQLLENTVKTYYDQETHDGYTVSFKPNSFKINLLKTECNTEVERVQAEVSKIRGILKERMKSDFGFQREKEILWQCFLVDPDGLLEIYEEAKKTTDQLQFANI